MSFLDLKIPGTESLNESANDSFNEDVSVPVPGGLSEKPSGAPKDVSITASKTEISADAYNSALGKLQSSFKEAYDLLGELMQCQPVQETAAEKEAKFVENAVDVALMEAFDNGPIFEAVDRSDKKDIKTIVTKLRKEVKKSLKEDDASYYPSTSVIKNIAGAAGTESEINTLWSSKMWQVIGVCHLKGASIAKVLEHLNADFKDDLGEYKILAVKVYSNLYKTLQSSLKWTDKKNAYLLLVDKKVPAELKEYQTELDNALDSGKDKEEALKEYEEFSLDDFSCYIEATIRNKIKDAVTYEQLAPADKKEARKQINAAVRDVRKDITGLYKQYKAGCKGSGQKKELSKKEFVDMLCDEFKSRKHGSYTFDVATQKGGELVEAARDLLFDESFEDIQELCEASMNKMVKNGATNMIKSEMSPAEQEFFKKEIKKFGRMAARSVSKAYQIYKKSVKDMGGSPVTKEKFAEMCLNEDESIADILNAAINKTA